MKVSKILGIAVFLIASFIAGNQFAYAATPTPTAPEAAKGALDVIQRQCGLADVEGAQSCCPTLNTDEKVDQLKDLVDGLPIVGGSVAKLVDGIYGLYVFDPIHSRLVKECLFGDPVKKTTTDPRTRKSVETCTCSTDKYAVPPLRETAKLRTLCEKYPVGAEQNACISCANTEGVLTGIGCIPTNYSKFVSQFLLRVGIGLAGLIALGCIIMSAITIQTSAGDAEKISKAQDQIKSCIFGLLLVMFSILLLKIIGVSILGIPGFI